MKKVLKSRREIAKAASDSAREKKENRRKATLQRLIDEFFSVACVCGRCKRGDISALCMTASYIARNAEFQKIPTPRGDSFKWKPNSVTNLIRKEGGDFRAKKLRDRKKRN